MASLGPRCRAAALSGVQTAAAAIGLYGFMRVLEENLDFERMDRAFEGPGNHHDVATRALWSVLHDRHSRASYGDSTLGRDPHFRAPSRSVTCKTMRQQNHSVCEGLVRAELERRGQLHHAWKINCKTAVPGGSVPPAPSPAGDFQVYTRLSTAQAHQEQEEPPEELRKENLGAFVRGRCRKGDLVSVYIGPIYSPVLGHARVFLSNLLLWTGTSEYMMRLSDSYIVDGDPTRYARGATLSDTFSSAYNTATARHVPADRHKDPADLGAGRPTFVSGAYTNHPPQHVPPNTMFVSVLVDTADYSDALRAELGEVSWYAEEPWTFDGRRFVRTVILVALRDVRDEELFVDYEFSGTVDHPDWYFACGAADEKP